MTKLNDRKSAESLVKTVSGLSPDGNGNVGLGHQDLNDREPTFKSFSVI